MSETPRLRGDEGYEVCDAVVTLRGLRNAVTAHRSAKNAAPPLASPVFSSARFAVPLLPAAQRFSVVTLLGPNNAVPTRTRVAPSATASG